MDLTAEALKERCALWQAALRLQDWDVTLKIVRQRDIGGLVFGDCQTVTTKREAIIRILDPRDFDGQGFDNGVFDWEKTLVHELLHLHMDDVLTKWPPADDPRHVAAERMIDATARALIALARRRPVTEGQ